jgi:hypothetical protein
VRLCGLWTPRAQWAAVMVLALWSTHGLGELKNRQVSGPSHGLWRLPRHVDFRRLNPDESRQLDAPVRTLVELIDPGLVEERRQSQGAVIGHDRVLVTDRTDPEDDVERCWGNPCPPQTLPCVQIFGMLHQMTGDFHQAWVPVLPLHASEDEPKIGTTSNRLTRVLQGLDEVPRLKRIPLAGSVEQ